MRNLSVIAGTIKKKIINQGRIKYLFFNATVLWYNFTLKHSCSTYTTETNQIYSQTDLYTNRNEHWKWEINKIMALCQHQRRLNWIHWKRITCKNILFTQFSDWVEYLPIDQFFCHLMITRHFCHCALCSSECCIHI